MAFANLREFHNPDLELPIGDKVYRIKSPSAADGIRLRLFFYDPKVPDGPMEQLEWLAKILGATWNEEKQAYEGGVWGEMEADGVSSDELLRAGSTALLHYGMNPKAAEKLWHGDQDPNQQPPTTGEPTPPPEPAANRAARRAGTKKAGTGRTTAAQKS